MPPRTPTPQEPTWAGPHRSRALRVGTVNGWPKPFNDEVLLRAVQAALASQGVSGVEHT